MENLLDAHLSEVVVDAVELGLVDVLVQVVGQRVGRLAVVAERLLDDDAPGLGQAGLGQALDHSAEEEGRDLEVEDRGRGAFDRLSDALVGRGIVEVAAHVREPRGETVEDLLVELLSCSFDRLARAVSQLVVGPIVDRHADDRTVQEPALVEPVERAEGHHLRQVARDPEDDQDVCRLRAGLGFLLLLSLRRWRLDRAGLPCHMPTSQSRCLDPSPAVRGSRHPGWVISPILWSTRLSARRSGDQRSGRRASCTRPSSRTRPGVRPAG